MKNETDFFLVSVLHSHACAACIQKKKITHKNIGCGVLSLSLSIYQSIFLSVCVCVCVGWLVLVFCVCVCALVGVFSVRVNVSLSAHCSKYSYLQI